MTVLIAEDEELSRKSTVRILKKLYPDMDIVEALNGGEAVSLSRVYRPNVVFIDMMMPVMTGLEAAEKILEDRPDTYIYLLTAYDSFSYAQKAINIGLKGYILKPPSPKDMQKAIEKYSAHLDTSKTEIHTTTQTPYKTSNLDGNIPTYPASIEKEILEHLKKHDITGARIKGQTLLDYLLNPDNNRMLMQEYINEFFVVIKRTLTGLGYASDEDVNAVIRGHVYITDDYDELRIWAQDSWQRLLAMCERKSSVGEMHKHNVLKAIDDDLAGITIEALAQQEGVSKSYISRAFAAWTNDSFVNYLTSQRIEKAKELLETTDMKLENISTSVGYSDVSYFCRLFKKVVGVSPAHYRRYKR